MTQLLALDLFSGGGGACIGLQQAGFEVVGIDIKRHRNYPGHFIQDDVLNLRYPLFRSVDIMEFDFIWASPPCQRFSQGTLCAKNKDKYKEHPDFIPATRELLAQHDLTCIENVPRSPIRKDLELTGPSVGLENIQRRRYFELSFEVLQPPAPNLSREKWNSGEAITVWTSPSATNKYQRKRRARLGLPKSVPKPEAKEKMGIPLEYEFTNREIGEAVAPPMAKYIADEAMRQLLSQKEG